MISTTLTRFLICCVLAFLLSVPTNACTVIIAWDDDRVLVGNNEDWMKYDAKFWAEGPGKGEQYGAVFFGFKGDGKFPQGGVNSQGLFFDGTYIDKIPLDPAMRTGRRAAKTQIFKYMLKRCANVEEALYYLDMYFIPFIRSAQVVIADKSGDYAVIHANGVVQRRREKEQFAVVTNFHLSKLKSGQYMCPRYDAAHAALTAADDLTTGLFRDILQSTQQNGESVKTVYSNIYDLTAGKIYNYYMGDFGRPLIIDVDATIPDEDDSTEPRLFQDQAIFEKQTRH